MIINEIGAASSDRRLQFDAAGYPHLGTGVSWYEPAYDASWWRTGPGPLGFGPAHATNVQSNMLGKTPSLYLRQEFTLNQPLEAGQTLQLEIDYADGFIAYLNGAEIARRNLGPAAAFAYHDQHANNIHPGGTAELIAVSATSLLPGANVLALQAHNNAISDGTFKVAATLKVLGGTPATLAPVTGPWAGSKVSLHLLGASLINHGSLPSVLPRIGAVIHSTMRNGRRGWPLSGMILYLTF